MEDDNLLREFPDTFDGLKHTTLHWILCSWQNPADQELVTGKLYAVGEKGTEQCQMIYFLAKDGSHKQGIQAETIVQLRKDSYLGGVHIGFVFQCKKHKDTKRVESVDVDHEATEKLFMMSKHDSIIQNELLDDGPSSQLEGEEEEKKYAFYKIVHRKVEMDRLSELCGLQEVGSGKFEPR